MLRSSFIHFSHTTTEVRHTHTHRSSSSSGVCLDTMSATSKALYRSEFEITPENTPEKKSVGGNMDEGSSKRPHSMVSPCSPESNMPVTASQLLEILHNSLKPLKDQMDGMGTQMKTLETKMGSMEESLSGVSGRITELSTKVTKVETDLVMINEKQESSIKTLTDENLMLRRRLVALESYTRRDNLIFYNIPEQPRENTEQGILELLSAGGVNLNPRCIVRCHRLGQYRANQTRPIIVKFHHYKDKMLVMEKRSAIMNACNFNLGVNEDFPREVQERRKIMMPIFHAAKKLHQTDKVRVSLNVDMLLVGNDKYTVENIEKLPANLSPHSVATPQTEDTVAFFTKQSKLSNFYPCKFEINNVFYNSIEQWVSSQKALMFGDLNVHKTIMSETEPRRMKAMATSIKSYDADRWRTEGPNITIRGLRAKFTQCQELGQILMNTGKRQIVEASPDTFWGIGVHVFSKNLFDQSKWTGKNIMGNSLMTIRSELE